jgi:hypothetical protein
VKDIDTITVVVINVRIDVSSIGAPKSGRKGMGKMNMSQTPARITRTYYLFLQPITNHKLSSSSLQYYLQWKELEFLARFSNASTK